MCPDLDGISTGSSAVVVRKANSRGFGVVAGDKVQRHALAVHKAVGGHGTRHTHVEDKNLADRIIHRCQGIARQRGQLGVPVAC